MTDNHTRKGTFLNIILAAVLTAAFVIVVRIFYVFTYGVIDDAFIQMVLSGAYTGTPDAHVVYIKYPLAWILKMLFTAVPGVNWHFHLLTGCFVASVFLVVFRICSNIKKILNRILFSVLFELLFLLCLAKWYTTAHYSMCAGVLVGTAIFYFLTIKKDCSAGNRILNYIVCLLLLYLAYCLRARTVFMLLPLAFVAFLYQFFREKPAFRAKNVIRWILFPILLFAGIAGLELGHRAAYRSEEWKAFLTFNDARTTLYDFYGVPPYEGNEAFYGSLGISKERALMYKDGYYLEFTDGMEEDMLPQIAEYAVKISYEKVPFGERLLLTLKALPKNLAAKTYRPMSLIAAGLFLFLLIASLFARKKKLFLFLLLGIVASLIPWLYMIFMGKPAARVTSGIWYADILFVLALFLFHAEEVAAWIGRKENAPAIVKMLAKVILAAGCAVLLFGGIWKQYGKVEKDAHSILASGTVRAKLEEWCESNPENLYVCESDVITLGFDQSVMDDSFHNLYWPGGWPSKMPQAKEIWDRYGITSIETAILTNEHVYLIAFADCDMTYWTDFYKEKDPNVKLTKTETLEFDGVGFAVYRLRRN
ncbi:MAG: hypothetical protein IKZ95_06285 [Lachnospiraceae bacterium]|nr:hypothetical protein [Lachnospiraceae bacterium]